MRSHPHLLTLCLGLALALPSLAHAADEGRLPDKKKPAPAAKPAKAKSSGAPNVQLDLPAFGEIPKGENLHAPAPEKLESSPQITATNTEYTVVSVMHAKGFMRGPNGSQPMGGGLSEITLTGNPPTTHKFTTVVRVRCKQRVNAPIEVVILDNRGDTFMSGSGEVNYRGVKKDEVDYTIDWDPTPYKLSGDFQVLVRIAGQPMGTWPLKFVSR